MAASMLPYNEALVLPLKKLLNISDGRNFGTRKISDVQRMLFPSTLLPSLFWDELLPLICGPEGLIGRVYSKKNSQAFLFIYLYEKRRNLVGTLQQRGTDLGLKQVNWVDTFLFYCAHKLELPLARGIDARTIPIPRLKLQTTAAGSTADYHAVVDCYGTMVAFEIDDTSRPELGFIDTILPRKGSDFVFESKNNVLHVRNRIFPKSTLHSESVASRVLRPVNSLLAQEVDFYTSDPNALAQNILNVDVSRDNILLNRAGGLFFEFRRKDSGKNFVAVTLTLFSDEEREKIIDYLLGFSLNNQILDGNYIGALCYHVNDAGQLSTAYLKTQHLPTQVEGTLAPGLSSSHLSSVYEPILIFEREQQCNASLWEIAANIAVKFKRFRSPYIPDAVVELAGDLMSLDFDCHEHIYLSLTGAHWKHVFLEIYRVMERLYYFGWMYELKRSLGVTVSEFVLFGQCANNLKWKGPELDSIMNLLAIVPASAFDTLDIKTIPSIELKLEEKDDHVAVMRKFGSMIYSVRNTGVHLGDPNIKNINVSAEGWPKLIEAMYRIVLYFYREHSAGMPSQKV
jgi:hypothetical protein